MGSTHEVLSIDRIKSLIKKFGSHTPAVSKLENTMNAASNARIAAIKNSIPIVTPNKKSRKILYGLIGGTTAAGLGGGVYAYKNNLRKEDKNGQQD